MLRVVPPIEPLPTGPGLQISKDPKFSLPSSETVTQTIGVVASRGAGKTYYCRVLLEEMVRQHLPVVVIDPLGVFYGVKSSLDGRSPGLPVLILGGDFADVEITPRLGRAVAAWYVDEPQPTILDISGMRRDDQLHFVADFADELYTRNRRALHLIVDEADIFAPQNASGEGEKRSLTAFEEIIRRGRRRGIGATLVTQRAAVIAKDVLTQISVLVIMRMLAPQDRKAIEEWIRYHSDAYTQAAVLQSLGKLPTGTAWFWSPGWLKGLQKVEIRKATTFDSSITPKPGEEPHGPLVTAPVDGRNCAARLAEAVDPDEEATPAALRDRILFLESHLNALGIDARTGRPKSKKSSKGRKP